MHSSDHFDVIVVGGGHAGTEAALAAARLGVRVLLVTHNIETVGQMSCNPAIGGIGKGHLVKEIDAMDGIMANAADRAGIHFRILNRRKGPAVRATRAQADRALYRSAVRQLIEAHSNLTWFQQGVDDLIVEGERVHGVETQMGLRFYAPTVILTAGTFLGGLIHIGDSQSRGGRAGDPPSIALARRLRELPFRVARLKTGTPPRIDASSVDFSVMEQQPGDDPRPVFSFLGRREQHPAQTLCHITRTSERTHQLIREALHRSPLFSGTIEGVGPRYCPSIEDKVVRFAERDSHQIFIEPEGLSTRELYPNGISTSLPFDVQRALVHSIRGFERAHITRPGYAIEYDFFDPRDLRATLETKLIHGLYFAGQINGTTGYEEAAAQGLVAGANAALRVLEREPWVPRRDEAYIGVLIDDLITQGTDEPYRMFTSRAEYRLHLREDNADLRLSPQGHRLGLVSERRWRAFEMKREAIEREQQRLRGLWIRPGSAAAAEAEARLEVPLSREIRASELLLRPNMDYQSVTALSDIGAAERDEAMTEQVAGQIAEQIEIQARYAGYIERQRLEVERNKRTDETRLPEWIDYQRVPGLSNEVRDKLTQHRPESVGQASRIPGVTPAAISLLRIYLKQSAGERGEGERSNSDLRAC